jgi:hypothetical protein
MGSSGGLLVEKQRLPAPYDTPDPSQLPLRYTNLNVPRQLVTT